MLSSILVVVLALLAMIVSAQTDVPTNTCPKGDKECSEFLLTARDGSSIYLTFDYQPSTGVICFINSVTVQINTGTLNVQGSYSGGPQVAPAGASVVVVEAAGNTGMVAQQIRLPSFTTAFHNGAPGSGSGTLGNSATFHYVIGDSTDLAFLTFKSGSKTLTNSQVQSSGVYGPNTCGIAVGDPHFSGFLGQQFNLEGESGLTYNVLSAASVQLNTRLVQLNVGDALTRGEMRMARLKSLFVLPNTYWFDHAGPYMGELGVSMLNGHQLYAQAGAYESGFATVQLDGANMTVSAEAVLLGEGATAVLVSRPSAHQVVVSTASVSLTFTNSDHFFNIENAKLLGDFDFQVTPMGGALGQTANAAFMAHNKDSKWRKQVEMDALVESNDLFTLSAPAGTVAA